jgi:hypothetical protein
VVVVLVIVIVKVGLDVSSCLGCFSLLLKLAEVQDLRLAKFVQVVIEFCDILQLFPNQMTVHGPRS